MSFIKNIYLVLIMIPSSVLVTSCSKTDVCNEFDKVDKLHETDLLVAQASTANKYLLLYFDNNANSFLPFFSLKRKTGINKTFGNFTEFYNKLYVKKGDTLFEFGLENLTLKQKINIKSLDIGKSKISNNQLYPLDNILFMVAANKQKKVETVGFKINENFKIFKSPLLSWSMVNLLKKYYETHYNNCDINKNLILKINQEIPSAYQNIFKDLSINLDIVDYQLEQGWLFSANVYKKIYSEDNYIIWWIPANQNKAIKLAKGLNAYWGSDGWVYYVNLTGDLMRSFPKTKKKQLINSVSKSRTIYLEHFNGLLAISRDRKYLFYQYVYNPSKQFSLRRSHVVIYDLEKKKYVKFDSKYLLERPCFFNSSQTQKVTTEEDP